MNKKTIQLLLLILVAISIAISCSKKGNTPVANDPCAGKTLSLTATVTDASAGTNNGSLSVTGTGSTGFTYNINGGAFVSTTVFSNLAAGSYTVVAKDADGCTKQASFTVNVADVCAGKNFVFTPSFVAADKCAGDGQLTIAVTGGTGLQYKIDGSAYQAGTVFGNVSSGTHNVFAKDAAGCEKSASVTMPEKPAGPFFTDVKAMLLVRCVNCHTNGGANGGVNFDTDCGIVAKEDRIKVRAVDQGTMPQGGPQLNATEKAKITNWIAAGGKTFKLMSVTKKRLLLLGLLVVCTGAFIGYREYNRKPASLTTQTPLYTIAANQLAGEFVTDEAAANKKFLGKPIEVTGMAAAETKGTTILLKTDAGISVSCSMDSLEYMNHATIKAGDPVKVRGICTGLLMDVELNRCVIIE